jgi:hypothetical protein
MKSLSWGWAMYKGYPWGKKKQKTIGKERFFFERKKVGKILPFKKKRSRKSEVYFFNKLC